MDDFPDQADLDLLLQSPQQWPDYNDYKPLDPSQKQIRVLNIWHNDQKDQIHASLTHRSLDDAPEYDALSYYWGPPNQQRPIHVEGKPVLIRRSLYSFLDVLCHRGQDRPVWLDSICINQRDVEERNSQVAMMGDIYRNATCVKAWIGEADADLEYSFAYVLNRANPRLRSSEHASEVTRRATASLKQVLSRPYWRRLWIVQELGLARTVVVLAGQRSVELEDLIEVAVHEFRLTGTFLSSLLELRTWSTSQGLMDITGSSATTRGGVAGSDNIKENWLSSETIMGRLSAFGNQLCENPRDKIFGLVNLSVDGNLVKVDYEKTTAEIVTQLLHGLAEPHAHIVGGGKASHYALPLEDFQTMFAFAGRAAARSSLEIGDVTDLENPKGYELYCGISCLGVSTRGRPLTHLSAMEFRPWGMSRARLHKRVNGVPHPQPKPLSDSTAAGDDGNLNEMPYDGMGNSNICCYVGRQTPDRLGCMFFRILPMSSTTSNTSPYRLMLVVEFGNEKPRVAGVLATQNWWATLLNPGALPRPSPTVTPAHVLVALLLEEEVQVCSKVIFNEKQSWHDGKMQLNLHCSRFSSLIMLVAGRDSGAGLNATRLRNALIEWRAIHPQRPLCDCEYQKGENLRYKHLVQETNIEESGRLRGRDQKRRRL